MSKITFPELHKILSEVNEDTLHSIGVPAVDDGLSPGPRSNAGVDNKQPDSDPHALQASTSEPNFDDNLGNQPVREPSMAQASSPAESPTDRENHYKLCESLYSLLLRQRADTEATVLSAGDLRNTFEILGMSSEVPEDKLRDTFKATRYADESGFMDFECFTIFAEDFKLFESIRAYNASKKLSEGGEYSERGPLREFFKNLESGGLQPGFLESSSNDGGMRNEPLLEPPVLPISTSEFPNYRDIMHRRECQSCCIQLLSRRGDPNTTALLAGALCGMLKELGMAPEVTDDKLRDMLKFSGYTDEDGTLEFEQFATFAKDFDLLESLRVQKASRLDGLKWPYAEFFDKIASGETIQYKSADFSVAFDKLGIKLTDEFANILALYANLDPGISITFEEFVHRRDSEHLQRTGQTMSSHRNVALNKGYRLGRLMAFVSSYIRSYRPRKFGYNANS